MDSFPLLPESIAESTYILFLGKRLEEDYTIEYLSEGNPYKDHFIECGNIDKEFMPSYYQQSDVVALLSLSEGFGLSLIEGMHYGLPCIAFNDIDAFDDIYNDEAVIGIESHDNEAVADSLKRLLQNQWNEYAIKQHSRKYEPEVMANYYVKAFSEIENNN